MHRSIGHGTSDTSPETIAIAAIKRSQQRLLMLAVVAGLVRRLIDRDEANEKHEAPFRQNPARAWTQLTAS